MRPAEQPLLDFTADAGVVRALVAGERLRYGHLINPTFATETALIDPLPHQRLAVYQQMLPQPRLRFLLADDAGAGKTIMAGLYIREMLARRLIQRVLIVPPAGLVRNWLHELRTLFSLPVRMVTGSEARTDNPFVGAESHLLIVSVDTLAGERMMARLQEPAVVPYDLVIFDEGHKLAADREPDFRIRKTDRYRLAEALAGAASDDPRWHLAWHAQHLIVLTATPHMGKDYPYYCLWRLLEPEVFATLDAFNAAPAEMRQRYFLRRTKEEMVTFAGTPLYPTRITDTISYALTQGAVSEQTLYDQTTAYIDQVYNQARILNRSAARFAMSIFQRRLASSTAALLCSLERRLAKLDGLIADIESGRLSEQELLQRQCTLDTLRDPLDTTTADEEEREDGREAHELVEETALGGVAAVTIADLRKERQQVQDLRDLARQVDAVGAESKFTRLRELLRDPAYADEKAIIFTEHRDTLTFLVRRFEGIGLTGQIAQIHGGMDYPEREAQIQFFKQPVAAGGARYLIATDAAGEGINLQFCWLMINYDLPWNPARLEQRMGRIHRYDQTHDPVIILNLLAGSIQPDQPGSTREGKVMQVLLAKLERIRKELHSDKVFDVIGRVFAGTSLTQYMQQALTDPDADAVVQQIEGRLTTEQVAALLEREQRLYGDGGDVAAHLPDLQAALEHETLRRLLPGYVRYFVEQVAPLVGLRIMGDLNGTFTFQANQPGALDPFLPLLERYDPAQRTRFTVTRPAGDERATVVFLRPGEPVFERLYDLVQGRYAEQALHGAIFSDPTVTQPYLLHIALIGVVCQADRSFPALAQAAVREVRLVGVRQTVDGQMTLCPVEQMLLLRTGARMTAQGIPLVERATMLRDQAQTYLRDQVATPLAEAHAQALRATLPERTDFLKRGYSYQDAELARARTRLRDKARTDPRAKGEVTKIKQRQQELAGRREAALMLIQREPELIAPNAVEWIAHALVLPASDPEERARYAANVEAIAMQVARAYEEARGATVCDVSRPEGARAADLEDYPGFDLLALEPQGERRAIEVKGRAASGAVELTENEWIKACNLGPRYWLYVVYDCASPRPRLLRVQDPFRRLVVRTQGSVVIGPGAIAAAAEGS